MLKKSHELILQTILFCVHKRIDEFNSSLKKIYSYDKKGVVSQFYMYFYIKLRASQVAVSPKFSVVQKYVLKQIQPFKM